MNASDEKCPSCRGPVGPWSVSLPDGTGVACSDACATALGEGKSLSDVKVDDYATISLGVDVLRKALLRARG